MVKAPILANELPSYAQCVRRRFYLCLPCCRLADLACRSELCMDGCIEYSVFGGLDALAYASLSLSMRLLYLARRRAVWRMARFVSAELPNQYRPEK